MSKDTTLVGLLASIVTYTLAAWVWSRFFDSSLAGVGTAFAVLVALRSAFAIVEWIADALSWYLYRRQRAIEWLRAAIVHPKASWDDIARPDARFRFEALPVQMQIELLRWIAGAGFLPETRTNDVIRVVVEELRLAQPEPK